jgi:lincosamide nucleotidyltransferase A/C/D/E
MQSDEVLDLLTALRQADCEIWIAGGWGVDALAGHQTRPHRDLDLAVNVNNEEAVLHVLTCLGYLIDTDWRPVRVELARPNGGWVDLHPVTFDARRHGRQPALDGGYFEYPPDAFGCGVIDGVNVPCLSREQQLRFHRGYEPRAQDLHDLQVLERVQTGST